MRMNIDQLIVAFDQGLRTLVAPPQAARPRPGSELTEVELSRADRRLSGALMRVNHCGEICAQALYQGQALASKDESLKAALKGAAREEEDHLAWCAARIAELGGRTSVLNPLWYAGSLTLGYAAGRAGDAWNLGFLKETEKQVEGHLQSHLSRLSAADAKTRALVQAMQQDEAEHARTAERLGARELPQPVKGAMAAASKVMTSVSYWL